MEVETFLMEICAWGTFAPDASSTVPESVAPVTCAQIGLEVRMLNAKATNIWLLNEMVLEVILAAMSVSSDAIGHPVRS
jgi:hypothetical protein